MMDLYTLQNNVKGIKGMDLALIFSNNLNYLIIINVVKNKDISRDMGSATEGKDSRAPACQDSMS